MFDVQKFMIRKLLKTYFFHRFKVTKNLSKNKAKKSRNFQQKFVYLDKKNHLFYSLITA